LPGTSGRGFKPDFDRCRVFDGGTTIHPSRFSSAPDGKSRFASWVGFVDGSTDNSHDDEILRKGRTGSSGPALRRRFHSQPTASGDRIGRHPHAGGPGAGRQPDRGLPEHVVGILGAGGGGAIRVGSGIVELSLVHFLTAGVEVFLAASGDRQLRQGDFRVRSTEDIITAAGDDVIGRGGSDTPGGGDGRPGVSASTPTTTSTARPATTP
jgi:hypothetical protein